MKNKASVFLKRIVSLVSSIAKAKSVAAKSKTSAIKGRLILFSLMKSKKVLLGSISDKIHSILGQSDKASCSQDGDDSNEEDQSRAIVLYSNAAANDYSSDQMDYYYGNDDDNDDNNKYPDLTHCLFDEEEFNDPGGSIIDLVKNSKEEGEDFSLENEIDHVADLFIMRFHKQMRLQKLESFKRFQEMLERSA